MSVCVDLPDFGPGRCDACGAALTGRAVRWCSTDCRATYWAHHQWGSAREHVLARAFFRTWRGNHRWKCARCGCGTPRPEVNHKRPALGAHSRTSCAHHQDNLEVLCHDCHLTETRRQRTAGELGNRPKAPADQLALPIGAA